MSMPLNFFNFFIRIMIYTCTTSRGIDILAFELMVSGNSQKTADIQPVVILFLFVSR